MSWKGESLRHLFNPSTIAVIGASDKPDRLGALALLALDSFNGKIYPINPRLKSIGKLPCYPSLSAIEDVIDLALICVGGPSVSDAMNECAASGIRAAIIFAAGFKELGEAGEAAQDEIRRIADSNHIAVIGPNCLGAGNIPLDLNATFFPQPIAQKKGTVSIISQSGGVCGLMLYAAGDTNVGISKFVSVGNRVNIEFHDLLRYFKDDDKTQVICVFIEGIESGRELYESIKEITQRKPVIAFKVGKTPVSREAAYSHTGSLAGRAEVYSGAIKQAKGIEVESVEEMMDTAKILSMTKAKPHGRSVAIVTHTLGVALIAAQTLEENSIHLPQPPQEAQDQIQGLLGMPVQVPIRNPIDLLAQGWADPDIFAKSFEVIAKQKEFDAIMTVFAPNYLEGIGGGMPVRSIIETARKYPKLVVSVLSSPVTRRPPGAKELEDGGIPVFTEPQRAGRALANVLRCYS